jgi:hypothetical protein
VKMLLFFFVLSGCADAVRSSVDDLNETQKDVIQGGCSWREGESGFAPREGECFRVYAAEGARLSSFQLSDICDAPKLPSCVALRSSELPRAYYDRTNEPLEVIVRYERVAVLPDGSCEPCE